MQFCVLAWGWYISYTQPTFSANAFSLTTETQFLRGESERLVWAFDTHLKNHDR